MKNELPIPEAALRDTDAVEMLRVWIAEKQLHCSMKIGMYQEGRNIPEEKAWGTILADVVQHVANALQTAYGKDPEDSIARIRDAFMEELDAPTTEAKGEFLQRHLEQRSETQRGTWMRGLLQSFSDDIAFDARALVIQLNPYDSCRSSFGAKSFWSAL